MYRFEIEGMQNRRDRSQQEYLAKIAESKARARMNNAYAAKSEGEMTPTRRDLSPEKQLFQMIKERSAGEAMRRLQEKGGDPSQEMALYKAIMAGNVPQGRGEWLTSIQGKNAPNMRRERMSTAELVADNEALQKLYQQDESVGGGRGKAWNDADWTWDSFNRMAPWGRDTEATPQFIDWLAKNKNNKRGIGQL